MLQIAHQAFAKPHGKSAGRLRFHEDVQQFVMDGGIERAALAQHCRGLQLNAPARRARRYPSRLSGRIAKGLDIRVNANFDAAGRRPPILARDLFHLPFGGRQH